MGSIWGKGDFCLGGETFAWGGNPRFPTPLYETLLVYQVLTFSFCIQLVDFMTAACIAQIGIIYRREQVTMHIRTYIYGKQVGNFVVQ